MGVASGLKALQTAVTPREEREKEGTKVKWLSLKDGESVYLRFLQEIDKDSPNYSEDDGTVLLVTEISDPKNFKKKCVSTADTEGKCFGWDMHNKLNNVDADYKGGWRPRERVYANVLVDNGKDEPFVAIFSQGTGPKSATPALVEYLSEVSIDENGDYAPGSITNVVFKLKRNGSQLSNTSYLLQASPTRTAPERNSEHELYDLNTVAVRHVPYDEQAEFFGHPERQDVGPDDDGVTDIQW